MDYLINKNSDDNGRNEVHKTSCSYLPEQKNQISLGSHASDENALAYAKLLGWKTADGCYYCCPRIHKG